MEIDNVESDKDFEYKKNVEPTKNTTDISYYIAEVARYHISDRAAAPLYNASLKTVGLITDDDPTLVLDR